MYTNVCLDYTHIRMNMINSYFDLTSKIMRNILPQLRQIISFNPLSLIYFHRKILYISYLAWISLIPSWKDNLSPVLSRVLSPQLCFKPFLSACISPIMFWTVLLCHVELTHHPWPKSPLDSQKLASNCFVQLYKAFVDSLILWVVV